MVVKRLPAFTILETIIALLIIITIFAIITLSLSKVLDSNNINEKIEAHVLTKNYAIQTKVNNDYVNSKSDPSKYMIERQIDYYQNNKSLIQITITAKNTHGKLLDTYKEIIINNVDEKK
jgi:Tfp pilus assembly protein PilV